MARRVGHIVAILSCVGLMASGCSEASRSAPVPIRLTPGTSWQWQLDGAVIDETVLDDVRNPKKMFDIDLFAADAATIRRLHAKGIAVICYMETGAWEGYRPDASRYPEEVLGNHVEGFPEERFVDIRQVDVLLPILEARLDTRRFEGVRRNRARPRRHLQRIRHRVPVDPGSPAGLQPRRRRFSSRTRSLDRSEERGVT